MTVNIHTPKISLYNLFGDANAPEAHDALVSRCQLVTHVSRHNATGHSKDADLAHIHMLHGEKVAKLCESHNTYHAAGHTFAIMPYKDAQEIDEKVTDTAHSFEPSVLLETIEKIKNNYYRVLIPIETPAFFRPIVDCINKHYIKGPDQLGIAHMIGKHFVAIPKQHFDRLVNIWQHDRISPAHNDLVKRLNDFNAGEKSMDSQLQEHLNTLLGIPGENATREQLDAKAYICVRTYRSETLSVDHKYMENKYGKEFADAVKDKYRHSHTKNQHNHIFPLSVLKTAEKYIDAHPEAATTIKDEKNGVLKILFQSAQAGYGYHILFPTPKTEKAEQALPKVNREYGAAQPISWDNSIDDERYAPKWSLSMSIGQYETLANAWLGQGKGTSSPHSPAPEKPPSATAYPHLSTFKPRERTTDTRPTPQVDNIVTFDFKKKERVR